MAARWVGEHRGAAAGSRADDGGARSISARSLLRLMVWLSPAFPVGGYSFSHGLEWVVGQGEVADASSLAAWVEDVLQHGAGRSDAIFLAETWRAVDKDDGGRSKEVAELAAALAPSAERRLETLAQGTAFLGAVRAVWPQRRLDVLGVGEVAFPVAVGAAAAAHGLPLLPTAEAFCQAFAANLVSAGVRLIPLGQTDGLRVLAQVQPSIPGLVGGALDASLDDVGGATIAADIASMRHETQYTRLFRS
jgi:urease accessory protein